MSQLVSRICKKRHCNNKKHILMVGTWYVKCKTSEVKQHRLAKKRLRPKQAGHCTPYLEDGNESEKKCQGLARGSSADAIHPSAPPSAERNIAFQAANILSVSVLGPKSNRTFLSCDIQRPTVIQFARRRERGV
jgi:hypothetical protein